MAPLLEVRDAAVEFSTHGGTIRAVDGVSLTVNAGETVAVVGESGCGKTTLARAVLGLQTMVGGHIFLNGEEITSLSAHARVGKGLSRTFQINQLFGDFTPLESVMLAISEREGRGNRFFAALKSQRDLAAEAASALE